MRLFFILMINLCLLANLGAAGMTSPQDAIESYTKVGERMPSFTIAETGGRQIKIDDLKGKVVLVNFWATWCPPCLVELPRLEKEIWRKYKSDDFVMLAIAREQSEPEITAFRKENKFTFPIASDPHREAYKLFGSGGIPRSYVVGADGNILFQSIGYDDAEFDRMKKVIEAELAKVRKSKAGE